MLAYKGENIEQYPHLVSHWLVPGLSLLTNNLAPRTLPVTVGLRQPAEVERYRERIAQLEAAVAHLQRALKEVATQRDELREQCVRDPLTALFNRRYMDQTLEQQVSRARRFHTSLAFLIFDVNNFKGLNDRFGHLAGDAVLREVGRLIQANIRAGDIACRYGGDEFIIVMPETSLHTARRRGEQLQQQVSQLRMEFEAGAAPQIRLSMGVAAFPEDGGSGIELVQCADAALYRAKRCARDEAAPPTTPVWRDVRL